ncbi:MAG: trehalase-like domain-containing protein, partial [Kofleriaceae bacterium]
MPSSVLRVDNQAASVPRAARGAPSCSARRGAYVGAMAAPLEHYGLIGDTTTVALISRTGSLDWMCLPRIDSDACFAQLIGGNQNGYWSLRPAAPIRSIDQHYRPETLILETDTTCDGGRVRVVDFMPPSGTVHDVIRVVEGLEGEVPMHCDVSVRFGYGKLSPWITCAETYAHLTAGPDALALFSPVPLEPDRRTSRVEATFTVHAGQRIGFSLEYYPSHEGPPARPLDIDASL